MLTDDLLTRLILGPAAESRDASLALVPLLFFLLVLLLQLV